jgi:hypothetical protein
LEIWGLPPESSFIGSLFAARFAVCFGLEPWETGERLRDFNFFNSSKNYLCYRINLRPVQVAPESVCWNHPGVELHKMLRLLHYFFELFCSIQAGGVTGGCVVKPDFWGSTSLHSAKISPESTDWKSIGRFESTLVFGFDNALD